MLCACPEVVHDCAVTIAQSYDFVALDPMQRIQLDKTAIAVGSASQGTSFPSKDLLKDSALSLPDPLQVQLRFDDCACLSFSPFR